MKKKKTKSISEYWAHELGLPVLIKNVPVIEIDGHEVVDINHAKISEALFLALIMKPFPLTGSEVRFMRLFMGLTLESLAKSLHVHHPTILAWEKKSEVPTKMTDSTEVMLRIFAAKNGVKDHELAEVIIDKFFSGREDYETVSKSSRVIELYPSEEDQAPSVQFIPDEDGDSHLGEVQEG